MPFYEALKYILNTANGKVRRKSWEKYYYLKREYANSKYFVVLMVHDTFMPYRPNAEELVSEDWEIVYDV